MQTSLTCEDAIILLYGAEHTCLDCACSETISKEEQKVFYMLAYVLGEALPVLEKELGLIKDSEEEE